MEVFSSMQVTIDYADNPSLIFFFLVRIGFNVGLEGRLSSN